MIFDIFKKKQNNVPAEKLVGFMTDGGGEKKQTVLALEEDALTVTVDGNTARYLLTDLESVGVRDGVGCNAFFVKRRGEEPEVVCYGTATYEGDYFRFSATVNQKIGTSDGMERHFGHRKREHAKSGRSVFGMIFNLFATAKPEMPLLVGTVILFGAIIYMNLYVPTLVRNVVNNFILADNPTLDETFWVGFVWALALYYFMRLVNRVFNVLRCRLLFRAEARIIVRLRNQLFGKVQALSLQDFSDYTSGELMQRCNHDTIVIRNFITEVIPDLLEQTLKLIAVSAVMLTYDWRMALLVLLIAPVVILLLRACFKFIRKIDRRHRETMGQSRSILLDTFSGIRVVKSYGNERREEERFVDMAGKERDALMYKQRFFANLTPLMSFLMGFGEYILLFYVGKKMLEGSMSAGDLAQFTAYIAMITGSLNNLTNFPSQYAEARTSMSNVFEILDAPVSMPVGDALLPSEQKGKIEFEHVSFSYDDKKEILHDVSFTIESGEFIGLVGHSGAGKSTIINLMLRMYDPTAGRILLDGVDIKTLSNDELHRRMSVVLQESYLFSGTVYQNIAYSVQNADRPSVIAAAKAAGAHDFIIKLIDGYDTYVGEKGYKLSGGERQRLSIARALLPNPTVLILDEATASLDTETERTIQNAFVDMSHGRTTIAIAHRLSTLRHATRLIVLDSGRIAEVGTHDELVAKGGIYADLVMAQRQMNQMNETKEETPL